MTNWPKSFGGGQIWWRGGEERIGGELFGGRWKVGVGELFGGRCGSVTRGSHHQLSGFPP